MCKGSQSDWGWLARVMACEIGLSFAKNNQVSDSKASDLFELIHCDLWGLVELFHLVAPTIS